MITNDNYEKWWLVDGYIVIVVVICIQALVGDKPHCLGSGLCDYACAMKMSQQNQAINMFHIV